MGENDTICHRRHRGRRRRRKEPHGRKGSGVYERVGLSAIFASVDIMNTLNGPNIRPR